jgi:hypothetical protein
MAHDLAGVNIVIGGVAVEDEDNDDAQKLTHPPAGKEPPAPET